MWLILNTWIHSVSFGMVYVIPFSHIVSQACSVLYRHFVSVMLLSNKVLGFDKGIWFNRTIEAGLSDHKLVYTVLNRKVMKPKTLITIGRCFKQLNQAATMCSNCASCFHAKCTGLSKDVLNNIYNSFDTWFCLTCSLPPFSDSFFDSPTLNRLCYVMLI